MWSSPGGGRTNRCLCGSSNGARLYPNAWLDRFTLSHLLGCGTLGHDRRKLHDTARTAAADWPLHAPSDDYWLRHL